MHELAVFEQINRNLRALEINEIVDLLGPLKIGTLVGTPILPAGTHLYRGRKITGDFNKNSKIKVSDLIYPPPKKTSLGRLNRAGKPMFYCASSKEIIFFELPNLRKSDEFILSVWQSNTQMLVNNIGYTDHVLKKLKANRECPVWSKTTARAGNDHEELIFDRQVQKEAFKNARSRDSNYSIRKALSDAFMSEVSETETYKYKLTTAIGELHFGEIVNSPWEFAGVMYPTIQMMGNGDNLALLPKFVDKHVEFISAFHVRINDRKDNTFSGTKIDFAKEFSEDGTLKWLGRLPNWTFGPGPGKAVAIATVGRDEFGDYSLGEDGNPLYWKVTDLSTGQEIRPK